MPRKRSPTVKNPNVIRRSTNTTVRIGESNRQTGSAVALQVGGRHYPISSHPGCKTCASPHRASFEELITRGASISAALRRIDQSGEANPVEYKNLWYHVRNHMQIDASLAHAMGEAWQRRTGLDPMATDSVVTSMGIIETVMSKGFANLADPSTRVGVTEALSAAKLMLEWESKIVKTQDPAAMLSALQAYLEVSKGFIDPARMNEFISAIDSHPVISAMLKELAGRTDDGALELPSWEEGDEILEG